MGELLKLFLNELWRIAVQPVMEQLDWLDGIFLAVLTLAAFGWWNYWPLDCSAAEKNLWGALVPLTAIVWFVVRLGTRKVKPSILIRPLAPRASTSSLNRWRPILLKVTVPLFIVAIWLCSAYMLYRVHRFTDGVVGIDVACFENDPAGVYQRKVVEFLRDNIAENGLQDVVAVNALPRRIEAENVERARKLGSMSAAKFVLWGTVTGPEKVKSRMVTVDTVGTFDFQTPSGKYSGHRSDVREFYDLPIGLETLTHNVVLFLAGYKFFHEQQYERALFYFNKAQGELASIVQGQETGSPEKALLASIDFYIGNVSYYQSERELTSHGHSELWNSHIKSAVKAYEEAIVLTSHPIETDKARFIEPLNNLGFVQILSRNPQDAIASLQRADTICRATPSSYNEVCTIVKYNLGDAERKMGNHEEAIKLFSAALVESNNYPRASQAVEGRIFAGILHQAIAFSRVKIAVKSEGAEAEDSFRKAEEELENAKQALAGIADNPTVALLLNYNVITRARIQIGRGNWRDAIANLTDVQSRFNDPEINLLLSIAYSCAHQQTQADENFAAFAEAHLLKTVDDSTWKEEKDYEAKITTQCSNAH